MIRIRIEGAPGDVAGALTHLDQHFRVASITGTCAKTSGLAQVRVQLLVEPLDTDGVDRP